MHLIKLYFKIRSKTYVFTFINIMLYLLFCYKVLSLCTGILEIAPPLLMWRFSDLGALELYVL
jgi:hypothetical protein